MSDKTQQLTYINLVGFESKHLDNHILPKNRNVLSFFYYQHRTLKLNLRDSAKAVILEVINIWTKFKLSTISCYRCISKTEKLYQTWCKTQINKSRKKSPSQKLLETKFINSLSQLFDIAPTNADEHLAAEQIKFLLHNRQEIKSSLLKSSMDMYRSEVSFQSTSQSTENCNIPSTSETIKVMSYHSDVIETTEQELPLLSQKSTSSIDTTVSNYSATSDFANELTIQPKPKKIKLMTPAVVSAMDRVNVTSRQAMHLFSAFALALGINLEDLSVSHSTINRNRNEVRQQIANDIKKELRIAQCVVLHWDGKMLVDIVGHEKVERLAIILSGNNTQQLLGVPKLKTPDSVNQAIAITDTINEWNISDRIKAICFDTTAVNTGIHNGSCIRVENILGKSLLYLPCRHHIYELVLRSVIETVWPVTNSPNVPVFARFQKSWNTIDKDEYETGIQDQFICETIGEKKNELISFIEKRLQEKHDRDDYKELLELSLIFLGGTLNNGARFKIPGPNHHARWMSKALYSLKIYMFKKQFKLRAAEILGLKHICLFIINFYVVAWFNCTSAIKSPYQDLTLMKNLIRYSSVQALISQKASAKLANHLWYLSEEVVGLSLFDNEVSRDQKLLIVKAMRTRERMSFLKRVEVKDVNLLLTKNISDFASERSFFLFDQFKLSYKFFDKDPILWSTDDDYIHCINVLSNLKVINDIAERGVALMIQFNNCLTRDEEQKQFLLQVVENHRKKFPGISKQSIISSYAAE